MTAEQWAKVKEIVAAALDLPDAERRSFVERACGKDPVAVSEALSLLNVGNVDSEQFDGLPTAGAQPKTVETLEEFAAGTILAGRYRIVALLGRGGMGEVYRADDLKVGQTVALKFLPTIFASDPKLRERFVKEVRVTRQLSHPNICRVYDIAESDGHHFLSMEYIDGENLASLIKRIGYLSNEKALDVTRQLLSALAAAHERGVLHRDLKPANIMLDGQGRVRIMDFGIAVTAAEETQTGGICGTPAYMAPEQFEGMPASERTDIYSLGLVLYEIYSGKRAFGAQAPAPISAIRNGMDPVAERLIMQCLEPDPALRPKSVADIAAAIEASGQASAGKRLEREVDSDPKRADVETVSRPAASHDRSPAPPSSDAQIVAALVQRHRRGVLAAAVIVLVALAGGIYGLRQWRAQQASVAPAASIPSLESLQITQLTTSGNAERPAISPDGKYVAYVQHDGNDFSLWIRQTATASNVQIVPPQPGVELLGATVTPDGTFVDFVRRQISPETKAAELWRVPFLGGTPKRMIDDIASLVGWSPDGRRMALLRENPAAGSSSLVVADADGSHERVVDTRRNPSTFVSLFLTGTPIVRPVWSLDGRVIAMLGLNAAFETHVVFVDEAAGSERVVPVQSQGSGGNGLAWLNDGSLVLSQTSELGGPSQLWRLSYPDGKLSRLTNDLNSYAGVSLAANRSDLVTARAERRLGIWAGDGLAGEGIEVVPAALFGGPRISVAWATERLIYTAGAGTIMSLLPGRGTPEEIVAKGVLPIATLDGRTLVYVGDAGTGLWKADADGRRGVLLAPAGFSPSGFTADGQHVIFLSSRGGIQSPWMVSLDGGEPVQVVNLFAAAGSLDVSPDGKSILLGSRDDQNRSVIIMCDLPACTSRRTLPGEQGTRRGRARWTPDGLGVACIDGTTQANLWIQPLDGRAPRQLTHFSDGRTIADFAWSRDGKRLAIARATTTNDIVLFKGLRK
jgi:serine/threonine protein kinase/Tol biopolymer transport system component